MANSCENKVFIDPKKISHRLVNLFSLTSQSLWRQSFQWYKNILYRLVNLFPFFSSAYLSLKGVGEGGYYYFFILTTCFIMLSFNYNYKKKILFLVENILKCSCKMNFLLLLTVNSLLNHSTFCGAEKSNS